MLLIKRISCSRYLFCNATIAETGYKAKEDKNDENEDNDPQY